mgnify:CR=1 FL=1
MPGLAMRDAPLVSACDVPAVLALTNRIYTFSTFVFLKTAERASTVPECGPTAAHPYWC